MREQILHVLGIVQYEVSVGYLEVDSHVSTGTSDIIIRPHILIKLIYRLRQWLSSDIYQHAELRFQILTEASEKVEM